MSPPHSKARLSAFSKLAVTLPGGCAKTAPVTSPEEAISTSRLEYFLARRPPYIDPNEWGNHTRNLRQNHSITSSARASSVGGTSMPSALAVFKLMTNSYLVGVCTGKSAGFSPLRMRFTYDAARRY
jgi:hypothetical protein